MLLRQDIVTQENLARFQKQMLDRINQIIKSEKDKEKRKEKLKDMLHDYSNMVAESMAHDPVIAEKIHTFLADLAQKWPTELVHAVSQSYNILTARKQTQEFNPVAKLNELLSAEGIDMPAQLKAFHQELEKQRSRGSVSLKTAHTLMTPIEAQLCLGILRDKLSQTKDPNTKVVLLGAMFAYCPEGLFNKEMNERSSILYNEQKLAICFALVNELLKINTAQAIQDAERALVRMLNFSMENKNINHQIRITEELLQVIDKSNLHERNKYLDLLINKMHKLPVDQYALHDKKVHFSKELSEALAKRMTERAEAIKLGVIIQQGEKGNLLFRYLHKEHHKILTSHINKEFLDYQERVVKYIQRYDTQPENMEQMKEGFALLVAQGQQMIADNPTLHKKGMPIIQALKKQLNKNKNQEEREHGVDSAPYLTYFLSELDKLDVSMLPASKVSHDKLKQFAHVSGEEIAAAENKHMHLLKSILASVGKSDREEWYRKLDAHVVSTATHSMKHGTGELPKSYLQMLESALSKTKKPEHQVPILDNMVFLMEMLNVDKEKRAATVFQMAAAMDRSGLPNDQIIITYQEAADLSKDQEVKALCAFEIGNHSKSEFTFLSPTSPSKHFKEAFNLTSDMSLKLKAAEKLYQLDPANKENLDRLIDVMKDQTYTSADKHLLSVVKDSTFRQALAKRMVERYQDNPASFDLPALLQNKNNLLVKVLDTATSKLQASSRFKMFTGGTESSKMLHAAVKVQQPKAVTVQDRYTALSGVGEIKQPSSSPRKENSSLLERFSGWRKGKQQNGDYTSLSGGPSHDDEQPKKRKGR